MPSKQGSIDEKLNSLRALAAERRWIDILALLEKERSGSAFIEIAELFEKLGDEYASGNAWFEAINCYNLGLWGAQNRSKMLIPKNKINQYGELISKLNDKFQRALTIDFQTEQKFSELLVNDIIAMAIIGRLKDAEERLNWLCYSSFHYADNLETAADQLSLLENREIVIWLLRRAEDQINIRYSNAKSSREQNRLSKESNRLRTKIDRIQYPDQHQS